MGPKVASHLPDVEGPHVEKAIEAYANAKDAFYDCVSREIFSPSVRILILEAAAEYASARQKIIEAIVAQDNSDYVREDMRICSETAHKPLPRVS